MNIQRKKNIVIGTLFLWAFCSTNLWSQVSTDFNCFTIVVGKNVSLDGSIIVAHNEDDFGKQIVNLYKTPARKFLKDEFIELANGGKINQVGETNGFIWIELPGMKVADSFINDKGVVVASNGCPSREENPDSTDGGILYWLRRLVAERANSAKSAVKIAGSFIDKYGYVSSGRTYTFADRNEAWIFSAVYGKHWIAKKVPDDEVVVIPNYYTIQEINLSDTNNYLGSPDIISHAIANGWYSPESGRKFSFARAYTALTSINHPGNIDRIWRGINLLSKKDYPINSQLPFSFSPHKKLDVQDIMRVLRDHYEGSKLDKSDMYSKGNPHKVNNATICSGSTQYSFIAELRMDKPLEIGTKVWLTFFRPAINIYVPVYLGIDQIPNGFAIYDYETAMKFHLDPPGSTFDTIDTHAYWDFVNSVKYVDSNFKSNFNEVKNYNSFLENKIHRENEIFEDRVLKIYFDNPKSAIEMIDKYSQESLIKVRNRAIDICN